VAGISSRHRFPSERYLPTTAGMTKEGSPGSSCRLPAPPAASPLVLPADGWPEPPIGVGSPPRLSFRQVGGRNLLSASASIREVPADDRRDDERGKNVALIFVKVASMVNTPAGACGAGVGSKDVVKSAVARFGHRFFAMGSEWQFQQRRTSVISESRLAGIHTVMKRG
jgi:hypothetical protein